MYKILIVDDDLFNITVLSDILKEEYETVAFRSGSQLLTYLQEDSADMILLDYLMPQMDGLLVLAELKKNSRTASIPVVVLTVSQDAELEVAFLKGGAEDFITKPFLPEVVHSRINRILELEALRANLQARLDAKTRQMENVLLHAFTTVANIADTKEDFMENHSIKVANYAALIARELGWSENDIHNIYYTGLLHDIGKISVPDKIIRKSGALNEEEERLMQGHTSVGAEILKDVNMVKMADSVALYHHERYDGTGYPRGIRGDEIPLEARIVNIANAYDIMATNRIGRNRLSDAQIIEELEKGRGREFDPALVDVLVRMVEEHRLDNNDTMPNSLRLVQDDANSGQVLFQVMEANTQAVKRQAMKDSLTGIFNREYAEKYVSSYLRKNQQCAYIMIDLDNFKQVNDGYGHIAGDYALKNVANMLSEMAGNDGIACRMGGDEFSLFINREMNQNELHCLATDLLEKYNRAKEGNESIADTSLSVGIALAPVDGKTYQELYDAADKALYLAKKDGKNRYCLYNEEKVTILEDKAPIINLYQLKEMMRIGSLRQGSYKVPYKDFQRIYDFILRCIERSHDTAQLLLFSIRASDKSKDSPSAQEEEIRNLECAIVHSLRRNDVSTRYSSSQILVVLLKSREGDVDMIVQRILDNYEALRRNLQYEIITEQMSLSDSDVK